MEVSLKRESIQYCTPVYSDTLTREETIEAVVSDTLPDIARILDVEAAVYLRSKALQTNRVQLEGSVRGTVLYVGEESERLQKLEIDLPVTITSETEGTEESDALVVSVCLEAADARLLNPRKILFRASVCAALAVYRSAAAELPSEAEATPGLYTLTETKTVSFLSAVEEKAFLVSDEAELPAGCPPIEKLLCCSHTETVDEMKQVGAKMILQGTVRLDVLYLTAGDNSPLHQSFRIPFSQILDLPNGKVELSSVLLTSGGCYIEPLSSSDGITTLHLELHLCAQTLCRSEAEIRYIADAYSLRNACRMETETLRSLGAPRPVQLRQSLRETIETPDAPKEMLYTHLDAAFPSRTEKGAAASITVHALYRTQRGSLSAVSRVLTVEFECSESTPKTLLEKPRFGDVYISPGENALELRCPVELALETADAAVITYVRSLELDTEETAEGERPSLTVIRLGTDSLWSVAKKFHSTRELIESANPGKLEPGELILIPRGR